MGTTNTEVQVRMEFPYPCPPSLLSPYGGAQESMFPSGDLLDNREAGSDLGTTLRASNTGGDTLLPQNSEHFTPNCHCS